MVDPRRALDLFLGPAPSALDASARREQRARRRWSRRRPPCGAGTRAATPVTRNHPLDDPVDRLLVHLYGSKAGSRRLSQARRGGLFSRPPRLQSRYWWTSRRRRRRPWSRSTDVVGREEEVAALADFLDARTRLPAVLAPRGRGRHRQDHALAARRRARGRTRRTACCRAGVRARRLSSRSWRSATSWGTPSQEVLPALPSPQAKALAVALLVEEAEGSPQDQRAIALGFAGALRVLARSQPVAVAIDDLQWLDRPSAFVLEFALRRLREEEVAFLLTRRNDGSAPAPFDLERAVGEERLPRLRVGPLSLGALHRLLSDRLDVGLSRPEAAPTPRAVRRQPAVRSRAGRAVHRGAIRLEPARAAARHAGVGRPRPADAAAARHPGGVARGLGAVASHPRAGGPRRRRRRRRPARAGLRGARRRAGPGPHPLHPPAARLRHLRRGLDGRAPRAPPPVGRAASRPGGARTAPRARDRGPGRGRRLRAGARGTRSA